MKDPAVHKTITFSGVQFFVVDELAFRSCTGCAIRPLGSFGACKAMDIVGCGDDPYIAVNDLDAYKVAAVTKALES